MDWGVPVLSVDEVRELRGSGRDYALERYLPPPLPIKMKYIGRSCLARRIWPIPLPIFFFNLLLP